MKLALVRQKYTPFGGAERFVERALGTLAAQGTEVTLLCREWSGGGAGAFPIDICDPAYAKIMGRKGRDASFAHAVQAIIAQHRFDLVQSHERIPGCHVFRAGDGVHATWLELRGRAQNAAQRFATRIHPWHRYVLDAEAAMFRHPDLRAVICNSRMVRDDIRQRFGVAEDRLHLIHNGVDAEYFHPGLCEEHRAELRAQWHIPATAPLILFVGSGFERKGVATLLDALAVMAAAMYTCWLLARTSASPSSRARWRALAWLIACTSPGHSPTCGRFTAQPTCSACLRFTTPFPTPRWKRWPAACRW